MLERGLVLPHRIAALAGAAPHRLLMVRADSDERITYGQFHDATLRWAGALQRLGIQADDRIATVLGPSTTAYACWLGIAWLRAIELPVNVMLSGPLLEYVLNDSGARIVIVSPELLPTVLPITEQLPSVEAVIVTGEVPPGVVARHTLLEAATLLIGPPDGELCGPEHYDICCLCYTSGTTGPAKGVLVPWAEMWEFVAAVSDRIDDSLVYYSSYPMFHVSGKQALYSVATAGTHLVLRAQFSVSEFWPDVRRHGVTAVGLVGPMARMLFVQPELPNDADNPVRWAAIGPLFPEVNDFARRFGLAVTSGYGMTEIGAPLATSGIRLDWASCGRVRPGFEARIIDENDIEVAPGEVGELVVRSDHPWHLNAGYWKRPELTARSWRNGWFHTGDAFRRNEAGDFYFIDRLKDAIRRRGENISSFEVEVMANTVAGVAESAAVPVPSELGEEDVKVVVVPKPGVQFEPATLLQQLRASMPHYMCPRYVEVVDQLPKTPTNRVRKVELRVAPLNPHTWDGDRAAYVTTVDAPEGADSEERLLTSSTVVARCEGSQ